MKILATMAAALLFTLSWATSPSAEESKLNNATQQVQSGAKSIGSGVEETAKGVGKTVSEGAKTAGNKIADAGRAAEPEAKSAWEHLRDGAVSFGHSVKNFFTGLGGK